MSKKYTNKKKTTVKVTTGETVVVLPYDFFMHIAETYDYLATEQTDNYDIQWYRDLADSIRFQAGTNHFEDAEEYDEW